MKVVNLHMHFNVSGGLVGLRNHQIQLDFMPETGQYYSVGLHPWQVDRSSGEELAVLENLALHPQVLAIGECGLDRSIETALSEQKKFFIRQVEIAEKNKMPLILHAVKTYSDLLQLKKSRPGTAIPWILHGYNGNAEVTHQLVRQGFYFSFGPSLLEDREKINRSLKLVPLDHLFFETDESDVPVERIYTFAAPFLGLAAEELQAVVRANFKHVFFNDAG